MVGRESHVFDVVRSRLVSVIGALLLVVGVLAAPAVGGADRADAQTLPYMQASLTNNWVQLNAWPDGVGVEVTVDGIPVGTFMPAGGSFFVDPGIMDAAGAHLAPGGTVVASNGTTIKTLVLEAIAIEVFDVDTDVIAGTAGPGAFVSVGFGNETEGCGMGVTVDGSGWWSILTTDPPCGIDLVPDMGAFAEIYDDDGDATGSEPPPPPPMPWIQVSMTNNQMWLHQWFDGAVTVTADAVTIGTFDPDPGGELYLDPPTVDGAGVTLTPGMTVVATDGVATKALVLEPIEITDFDPATDLIAGTAVPGRTVQVNFGNEFGGCGAQVGADPVTGVWAYVTTDPPCGMDLAEDMGAFAEVYDDDGDSSGAEPGGSGPEPGVETQIQVNVTRDEMYLHGWLPDAGLTVEIYDPWLDETFTYGPVTDGAGHVGMGRDHLGLPLGLHPDMHVMVTDGVTTHDLDVQPAMFTAYERGVSTVFGVSPSLPIDEVRLHLFDHSGEAIDTFDGHPIPFWPSAPEWAFDLSAFDAAYTQLPLLSADFEIPDEDNDGTFATLPVITAWAGFSPDEGAVFSEAFDDDPAVDVFVNGGLVADDLPVSPLGDFEFGVPLQPGFDVTVVGVSTGITKNLTVDPVQVTGFDLDAGTVWGMASPFATLKVEVGNEFDGREALTHADASGAWEVDFASMGLTLVSGMGGRARAIDEDTDETVAWFEIDARPIVIEDAMFNIPYGQEPDGTEWYGFEAHVWARGDWGDEGPQPSDVFVTIDGVPYFVDGIEIYGFDGTTWSFSAHGMFDGVTVLGEYAVAVTDGTGATTPPTVVGVLEDVPTDVPTMTSGPGLSDGTPDFAWDSFQSEYLGTMVDPWAYELNLRLPDGERWVYPIDPGVTSVPFDDPAWEPTALTPLGPGLYFGVLHSNHQVQPGFSFEHHRGFMVVVTEDGFVTGGGWFESPDGTAPGDPEATGPVYFGLTVKYGPKATTPKGNLEIQLQPIDANFHSTSFEWLLVIENTACFTGSGTIDGDGDFGFFVCVDDGPTDLIRISIWDRSTGEAVYEGDFFPLEGGSIKVHHR